MTATALRVGLLQCTPGADVAANVRAALALADEALAGGAQFLMLPEHAFALEASGRAMRAHARPEARHEALAAFAALARARRCWVLLGSVAVATDEDRVANRSILLDADGRVAARYDKLHMFDATLPGGRTLRESSTFRPGGEAVAAATPWGRIGLTICYDVRFPALYRSLAQDGCTMLAVPSAFTRATGARHWHVLLRARAIENRAYVLAPATVGEHPGGHATYGHSLVVDPDGAIVAERPEGAGVVVADIDTARVAEARTSLPSLEHDRAYRLAEAVRLPSPD